MDPSMDGEGPSPWSQIRTALTYVLQKPVPGNLGYAFCLGSVCAFLMVNQLVTGSLLCVYYRPTVAEAYESVRYIQEDVSFGWLIRQLHAWGANLMILALVLHAMRVVWHASYRPPRRVNWLIGMVILGTTIGMGFTGYLLPWDQLAYWASRVGTEIPSSMPVFGPTLVLLLRAGEDVSGATLGRFFALHVIYLPAALVGLVALHVLLMRLAGISGPPGPPSDRTVPFFPNHVARDMVLICCTLALLYALVVVSPWELGAKADPLVTPEGIKPEWYFLWAYELLKHFPTSVGPVSGKVLGLVVCGLIVAVLVALPWLDRGPSRDPAQRRGVLALGAGILIAMAVLTIMGWTSGS